jgi:hypothetical protein
MITIDDYQLTFRFPNVHDDAELAIEFRRTLRIPDDGKVYVLPPSSRAFPLLHIDDCGDRVPEPWIARGGVIMPVYQAEAMYIAFSGGGVLRGYPCAVKIAAGMINAISGKPWKPELDPIENDYIVVPRQPRLDGFCTATSTVRQFVAMRLGSGYSVAEQLTGKDEHGGIQIIVYPMKAEHYEQSFRGRTQWLWEKLWLQHFSEHDKEPPYFRRARRISMSVGVGGRMKQPVYKDRYGIEAWDQSAPSRCFVTLTNAYQWEEITGKRPPTEPLTAEDYAEIGLPWFDHYAADLDEVRPGSLPLTLVRSVDEMREVGRRD